MHKFDDQASKILHKVLSHTIERLSMDPPPLDYPKSVDFFEKNAPSLITEAGNSIDKVFDQYKNKQEYKNIILEYFNYVKQKIDQDSIYRLLSPLLYIFFGIPYGKKFKANIHEKMKNYEIDKLETMFLQFIN